MTIVTNYKADKPFEIQRIVAVKLRVLTCRFCGLETPPPTSGEQAVIDDRKLPVGPGGVPFVTPMWDYQPEGWRILANTATPLGNFDRFVSSLVCPACVARMTAAARTTP